MTVRNASSPNKHELLMHMAKSEDKLMGQSYEHLLKMQTPRASTGMLKDQRYQKIRDSQTTSNAYLPTQASHTSTSKNAYATSRNSRQPDQKMLISDTASQSSMGSKVSYGQLSRAKPPSSCQSYQSQTSKASKRTMKGNK